VGITTSGEWTVDDRMREIIQARLREIEASEKIAVLFACESGSRGWQFASADSDYDVRFIYLHPLEWYLSLHSKRDVIERPITEQLDIVGWEFRKALQLMQRSNPRLLEWRSSPILYHSPHPLIEQLWAQIPKYFSPSVCGQYHLRSARYYLNWAMTGDEIHVKRFFYALRSVLVLKWIEETGTMSPMNFWEKVDRVVPSPAIQDAIQQLFVAKQQTAEQASIPRMPVLEEFCSEEIARFEQVTQTFEHILGPDQPLEALFQSAVLNSVFE
jgi:uncharacterized protein